MKKDGDIAREIMDAFESLSGVAVIFSPVVFGTRLLPLPELLGVKDRPDQIDDLLWYADRINNTTLSEKIRNFLEKHLKRRTGAQQDTDLKIRRNDQKGE